MVEEGEEEVPTEVGEEETAEKETPSASTLDQETIEEFYKEGLERELAVEFLANKLDFTEYTTSVKEAIQVRLYEQILNYSKTCGFNIEQTVGFVGLFSSIIESIKAGSSKEETESQAKQRLTEMCESVASFNTTIVKFMLDFIAQTVFQHFNLYSYVYQLPQREQELVAVTLEIETARVPPLSQGELQLEEEQTLETEEVEQQEEAEATAGDDEEDKDQQLEDQEDQEPNPVTEIIESEIARRVAEFKEQLSKEYASREEILLKKIKEIETS